MRYLQGSLLFCTLLFLFISSFGQNKEDADVTDVIKANFFDPGISFEKRIGQSQTLYGQAFLSTAIFIGYSSSLGNISSVDVYPALTLQYRYYYNGNKRTSKEKRIEMNSMNYISIVTDASFYKDNRYDLNKSRIMKTFGAAWGFQRNYSRRFSLDINVGIGYAFGKETILIYPDSYSDISYSDFTTLGQISLGFWLNRKK
jgi:hypothetical protein